MKNQILIITFISIAVGIIGGILIVLLVQLWRRRMVVDSLVSPNNLVGLFGTVEVPFDSTSKGKVRVEVKGSVVDFTAFTDEARVFAKGDRIFVVAMKGNKVWVISENSVTK
ncbi:MAG TPA: NfeD-like protein [Cyanobacteria bacterium UBA11370]|nr:NfeD-like protein [Cyanobacteria bacterium UBA11370]